MLRHPPVPEGAYQDPLQALPYSPSQTACLHLLFHACTGPKIICQGSRRGCNECKSLHNDIIEGEQWPTGVYFDGETSVIIAGADLKATVVADGTDAKVLIADHK